MGIILIGMPSSGKTTAGKRAAELLGCPFTDGDDLIRVRTGKSLPQLLAERGTEGFLALEEEVLCAFAGGGIFATGGSAVYSARAMAHLRSLGKAVYLRLSPEEAVRRIPDFSARGVVMRGTISTLEELYAERAPLYERYADVTLDCAGKSAEELAREIARI